MSDYGKILDELDRGKTRRAALTDYERWCEDAINEIENALRFADMGRSYIAEAVLDFKCAHVRDRDRNGKKLRKAK